MNDRRIFRRMLIALALACAASLGARDADAQAPACEYPEAPMHPGAHHAYHAHGEPYPDAVHIRPHIYEWQRQIYYYQGYPAYGGHYWLRHHHHYAYRPHYAHWHPDVNGYLYNGWGVDYAAHRGMWYDGLPAGAMPVDENGEEAVEDSDVPPTPALPFEAPADTPPEIPPLPELP